MESGIEVLKNISAAKAKFDYIITIGKDAEKIGLKAIEKGMKGNTIFFCTTADEVYNALAPLMDQNTVVLLKFPYKYRLSKDPAFVSFMKKISRQ